MTPERAATCVGQWVRLYTRGLAASIAARRLEEIEADLHDHIAHERAMGTGDGRIALAIVSRMVRGISADVAWRQERADAIHQRRLRSGGPMDAHPIPYRIAVVVALGAALLLAWGVAAMGVVGAEGDPFDLLYFAVLAIGIVGSVIARFRPPGMVRALLATAAAQVVVTLIALILGKQHSPVSSVAEIVGLNGLFVALFLGSAWLFARAARRPPVSGARSGT